MTNVRYGENRLTGQGRYAISQYRRAGVYVGKILNGAQPDELPIEQRTGYELVSI